MEHAEKITEILTHEKILTPSDDVAQMLLDAKHKHIDLEEEIAGKKGVKPEQIYQTVAEGFGVPYINLNSKTIDKSLIDLLPETIVQTHHIVIVERDANKQMLIVATRDPDDIQTLDFIQKRTGMELQVYYTDSASIAHIVGQYHKTLEEELQSVTAAPLALDSFTGITELNRIARDVPIVKVVDVLLNYALYQGASDIHIEPTENHVIIRYRIDGILMDVMKFPRILHQALIARIKVLANLKIDEHRLPQDGRFKITVDDKRIAFRVSIFPVYDGEKVVLRLLDESAKVLTFEQLGIQKERIAIVTANIRKPHGILLVTGPTGSGKTTTLYSVLNILNTPSVNISTVEDPIEYRIPRVNQAQISPKIGFSFAAGLRALLRQDPNIIMVGEIRDGETAEIAAHAAMTGHLVLSTLHTNDAIGAIPRLTEMGVPRYLVASTTNLIIAQRLVRKICEYCRFTVTMTRSLVKEMEEQLQLKNILETVTSVEHVEGETEMEEMNFYKGKGCAECGNRGYAGRIGIYEILEITDEIRKGILDQATPKELLNIAMQQGMMTMAQDGFLKAKQGLTTIEEILRVTKE
ncbi:MAG: Flp pilus assembly complex ATPase component TadA [Candidatus Kerfeldbacteria bacterium]|nr:Flp pilus assembly complex ATPase component TadA [Candidatus Kerfeldbacteria bacterium]